MEQQDILQALPQSAREKATELSARWGQRPAEVLAAAVESFYRAQQFIQICSDPNAKPENPRLVRLVPDPELRSIYRATAILIARDTGKHLTKEQIQMRGRAEGLARSVRLTKRRSAEICMLIHRDGQ